MSREARLQMPIRWNDLDSLGHVNHTVYHAMLEEVRYLLYAPILHEARGISFVLANINLNFRHEVRHEDGYVEVVGRIERIGSSSATASHEILLPNGTIAAEGTSTVVSFDLRTRRARKLTDEERAALTDG